MAAPIRDKSKTKSAAAKRPQTWQPGKSGNPAGRPKAGQSWAELIREIGDLDGPEAAGRANFLAAQFKALTPGVSLKELVVLRVYAALIDEPQPGLLNAVMERAEGKIKDEVSIDGIDDAIAKLLAQLAASRQAEAADAAAGGAGRADDRE